MKALITAAFCAMGLSVFEDEVVRGKDTAKR